MCHSLLLVLDASLPPSTGGWLESSKSLGQRRDAEPLGQRLSGPPLWAYRKVSQGSLFRGYLVLGMDS